MRNALRSTVVAVVLTTGAALSGAQQTATTSPPPNPATPAAAPAPAVPITRETFVGTWDYNARESVNAANGRPEQNPQSATQRRTPNSGPRTGDRPGTGSGTFNPPGGMGPIGMGNGGNPNGYGMPNMPRTPGPALITSILRDLARDLLEVPESLTVKVMAEAVSFTDDLDREQTFLTNGKKQKCQIGAAVYDARTTWESVQLKKNISASEGFKMTETYFLSTDAQRLFVIIRIGEQRKDLPVVGVNRMYDRVVSTAAPAADR